MNLTAKGFEMFARRRLMLIIPAASLLLLGGVLFSQDNDEDESNERQDQVTIAAPLDSASLAHQQAEYAAIDSGFQTVKPIFEKCCYDCHSQKTRYPWYHKLPLVKQFLDNHIKEGRADLDMTNGFPFSGKGEPIKLLHKIRDEIAEGEMPPWSYGLMHWQSGIDGARRDTVFQWIDSSVARLESLGR